MSVTACSFGAASFCLLGAEAGGQPRACQLVAEERGGVGLRITGDRIGTAAWRSATNRQMPEQPPHPMSQLTTFELRDFRRELERAIAFFDRKDPVPPARDRLQQQLTEVLAEQDSRKRVQDTSGRA